MMMIKNIDHGEKAYRAPPSRLFPRHQYVKCRLLGPAVSVSFDRQFRCRVTTFNDGIEDSRAAA
jgi:hypothetical protein